MMIMLDEKNNFSSFSVHTLHRSQTVTCHMTGHYAIHELPHGHIEWAFLYYRQRSINLIYQTAALCLC